MAKPEDTLVIETTKGRVTVEMRPDLAPMHVARIKELARKGFYDGVVFHRVIDGFMAQTGDPTGSGMGGSGQKLKAEFSKEPHTRGAVSMARAQSPEFRRQPVLHRLRRRELPRQQIYGMGPRDRRHGECRQDQSRRAAGEAGQDADGAGRRRRRVSASPVRVDAFDYHLPEELIALRPASPRDAARLLVVDPAATPAFADRAMLDLPGLLQPGDALVCNDTKVIPAELRGSRMRDGASAQIAVTLLERLGPDRWLALARAAKRLKSGDRIAFGDRGNACLLGGLAATVESRGEEGEVMLRFELSGPALDEAIATLGAMPLPPYIASRRPADEKDRSDYQTIFAREEGAVAAPTAGLHFTERLLQALQARGVSRHCVTLHVGAGTFLPVRGADTEEHVMHAERGHIAPDTAAALNEVKARGGNIVAVGTTALRLLESASGDDGRLAPFDGETRLFITPGYRFRFVDRLLTNFHLPRSTLFMLVSLLLRPGPDAARLCACRRGALSLLFLWRRLPAQPDKNSPSPVGRVVARGDMTRHSPSR